MTAWLGEGKIRRSNIEPPGCFNTGFAPAAVHQHYSFMDVEDVYLVGCVVDVRDTQVRIQAYSKLLAGGHVVKNTFTGKPVYVYKTARGAKRRYDALCAEALEARDAEVQEIRALQKKAKEGDIGAALALGQGLELERPF